MSAKKKPRREIFECPHCGADVSLGARSCRECGSDATTGWLDEQEIDYTGVDLPDGYRDPAQSDFVAAKRPLWVVVVALLLVGLLLVWLLRLGG
ncbi:MAG: zinc-ribbon domain-containing protein [Planctomycetes bacterium]|nr:zinc-ribbon domain-containing protein [Planctomycetota bacterium]MCC7395441.1 hypothetical protein [Planctomycetota bacterium]